MQGMIHVIYILIDYILNPTTFLYAFFKYQSHDLFMSEKLRGFKRSLYISEYIRLTHQLLTSFKYLHFQLAG
jgi:hypothetical protein